MTKREAAIVMAYTGTTMLVGDDIGIFWSYCSEIMHGRNIYTHEYPSLAEKIKEYSKKDFIDICKNLED